MPALTAYFALAGVLPFSIALACTARAVVRRPGPIGRGGIPSFVLALGMLVALAAIDTGFVTLAFRSAALALHPSG